MSSRLIVKNLSKGTTEKELRAHFASRGEVTDARVVKSKAGKSRLFGFVGFRTEAQARDCQSYFNNSFLQSAKIQVEMAVRIGDPSLEEKIRKGKGSLAVASWGPRPAPRGCI